MSRLLSLLVFVLPLACGSSGAQETSGTLLQPLTIGSVWTYEMSEADGSDREEKTVRVIAKETIDGIEASVVETTRSGSRVRVWLAAVDGRIVRLREQKWVGGVFAELRAFEPGSLRTPIRKDGLSVGERIDAPYTEVFLAEGGDELARRSRSPSYEIEATDDLVRTPVGAFRAVRIRKFGDAGDEGKLVWYAPGVGKVKEEGGKLEVLIDHAVEGVRDAR